MSFFNDKPFPNLRYIDESERVKQECLYRSSNHSDSEDEMSQYNWTSPYSRVYKLNPEDISFSPVDMAMLEAELTEEEKQHRQYMDYMLYEDEYNKEIQLTNFLNQSAMKNDSENNDQLLETDELKETKPLKDIKIKKEEELNIKIEIEAENVIVNIKIENESKSNVSVETNKNKPSKTRKNSRDSKVVKKKLKNKHRNQHQPMELPVMKSEDIKDES